MKRPFINRTGLATFGVLVFLSFMAFSASMVVSPRVAYAACSCGIGPCSTNSCCSCADTALAVSELQNNHQRMEDHTNTEFDNDLERFEEWLIEVMLNTEFVPAMADMATQMGAVAMKYTESIGMFLDAQNQIETQRLLRQLQHEAHKDYRPSEGFCTFGTNVRSLAATENKGDFNAFALSRVGLVRQIGRTGEPGAESVAGDYEARWKHFITTYCDRRDNNYSSAGLTGLEFACDHDGPAGSTDTGAEDAKRVNRDIDYTRLVEEPRTLDIDFTNNTLDSSDPSITGSITQPGDEEDVMALMRNLYGHVTLPRGLSYAAMNTESGRKLFMGLRSVAARRGVAQSSLNAIVGMKSGGTSADQTGTITHTPSSASINAEDEQTQKYMAAIIRELLPVDGTANGDVYDLIGHSPSYYAQLEILAKRIYQNPDFYADLYDTPANVARKKVAMKAIELMVDRAMYESQLRREMNISVLLSSQLRGDYRFARQGLSTSQGADE